nr:hypothetical protein [Tanacetum cinerariifolium]
KDDILDLEGGNVLIEKLLDLDFTKYLHPPLHVNPLSGSTTSSSSPNKLLEEFADELALITFPPEYDDDLQFDIESDLKEIEYLLHHDPIKDIDSILKDSIDQSNLVDLNKNLVDSIPEMFTDKHAIDYSSPPLYDEYDDDLFEVESDTENAYDDPFDSNGEKIKESELLVDEIDLPCDFLLPSEYDSFFSKDFPRLSIRESSRRMKNDSVKLEFWHTITKIKNSSSYKLKLDKKKCTIDVEVFRDILQISPRLPNQEFVVPPSSDEEIVSFIKELGLVMHTIQNDSILGSLRFVSKTKEYQVYGALIPKGMTNQKMQNSPAYKTYLAFATGAATPKKGRRFKKPASPSKKKALVAIEDPAKKPVKKPAAQRQSTSVQIRTLLVCLCQRRRHQQRLKEAKGLIFYLKPHYLRKLRDSDDEDADDDQQSDDDRTESDDDKSADINKIDDEEEAQEDEFVHTPEDYVPTDDENITDVGHVAAENENVNQDVTGDQFKDDAQAKVIVAHATQKTEVPLPSFSISSNYATKIFNFDNILPANTKIISMMDIKVQHENPSMQSSPLLTVPVTVIPETSTAPKTTVPLLTPPIIPLSQQSTSIPTPTTTEATTSTIVVPDSETLSAIHLRVSDALYHTLMESILEDEDAMDKGVIDKSNKRKPDDVDRNEGPPTGSNQGLKRKKTSKDTKPSKKAKSTESSKGATKSQPKSTGNAFVMNWLQISDLTQDILVGPAYKLLKGTCRSYIIPVDYFFNNDLAYLQGGSTSKTYTTSLTKTKAAKYDLQGIEYMVPNLWSLVKVAYDRHALLGTSHWRSKRQTFYGYTSNRNRLFNLDGDVIMHLATALRMFARHIVIQKRVEDLQLGVESYQKKLNISRPLTHKAGITDLEPYTTYSNPQGVIYLDMLERNRLMSSHELYKFSDGTLISVRDKLKDIANNLGLRCTIVMQRRKWSNFDKKWSRIMVKDTDCPLMERRLKRSLERFVGGREYKEDHRLLQRTI